VCVFCLFVCLVTDFSASEKDNGVKLRMLVRLLLEQVFSHFGELWFVWSHGGHYFRDELYINRTPWWDKKFRGEARLAVGI